MRIVQGGKLFLISGWTTSQLRYLIPNLPSQTILIDQSQMANFLDNIFFIFQRLSWLSLLDILLVTLIFFVLLYSLRDTQAMVLLRGVIFLVVALVLLTTLVELPAFSWLIKNALPALLLAIPVIFALRSAARSNVSVAPEPFHPLPGRLPMQMQICSK